MGAHNLEGVINELGRIIDWGYEQESRLGFFPALYRKVTIKVKEGIREDSFDDGPRMAKLIVVFANRYLDAIDVYLKGDTPVRSWLVAFEAAENQRLLILQHLFLGINAHINLDLGIAAAEIVQEDQLNTLRDDFEKINQILSNLVDEVQSEIGEFSPWLALLDKIGGRADERFADFSLKAARNAAWKATKRITALAPEQKDIEIKRMDKLVAGLAQLIVKAGPLIRLVIWVIRFMESKDVRSIILRLK